MPRLNAAYGTDQILLQLEEFSRAAEPGRALQAVTDRLMDIVVAGAEPGHAITVEKALAILSHLQGAPFTEADTAVAGLAVSNDTGVLGSKTWGLYGDVGSPTNVYGSQATEAWAAGYVGSTKVAVGVVDSGVDYTHQDLYLNIWLNQKEIPVSFKAALADVDADSLITFRDLNNSANSAYVRDVNANGRIDAGDLLGDSRWENGIDDDGNAYKDDLIGWDFVNNDNDPMDDNGHGTHVAGTIGAMGGNGVGVAGVAWNVLIVPLKFLDASNWGYTSANIKATDYFTNASKAGTGIDFVATNQSWGGASYSQGLQDAITRAAKADIFYIASAGNNAANNDVTAFYPANFSTTATAGYDNVISVGAITSTGALASFSNYGMNTVDIVAPGASIYSTLKGGSYGLYSGTSMAAPHVTGAIALYAAAHPEVSAAQIRQALLQSAAPTASVLDKVVSDGRLDISTFLQTVIAGPTPTPTPEPEPAPTPTPTTGVVISGTLGADSISPSATSLAANVLPTAYGDTISGLSGSDTLDGGAGADQILGGAGNDVYVVDNAGDTIVELAGEGVDLVRSSVSHTLAAEVESLTLTGSGSISGVGNGLDNKIVGNSGANKISGLDGADSLDGSGGSDSVSGGLGADTVCGGAGDDQIDGGAGADLYMGGNGKDTFHFDRGELAGDRIQDFAKGDRIVLHDFSAGSTVAKVAGTTTDWVVTDHDSGATEVLRLLNGYSLKTTDFLFG